jgi:hypothetical protein
LSQNFLAATPPQGIIAESAADRRQIIAGGASPRLGHKCNIAPEGRQKALPFDRFLLPFQG